MASEREDRIREDCEQSFTRIYQFDTRTLGMEGELGRELGFQEVVRAAKRLTALYNQVSLTVLEDLPVSQMSSLNGQCDADYNGLNKS